MIVYKCVGNNTGAFYFFAAPIRSLMISNIQFFFLLPFQDSWTHVNAKKGFLPKLWSLLKVAGKGMAKALHPNLMPLLSKLPQQVTDPTLDFYTTFFSSVIQG